VFLEVFKQGLIILFCIIAIAKGAVWLVDSAVKIARRFGISNLVIGLTIVAFGTSAPEFGVTILAAVEGMGDISAGNIVGSNIFNLGFILGGTAIIRNLETNKAIVQRDGVFLLFGTILLTLLLWDLSLNHVEGVLLFTLLVAYLGYLFLKKEAIESEIHISRMHWQDPFLMVFGMGLILGGSHFLVDAAVNLAKIMGISEWVIGTTIVAAGTSAPEFVTSLVAALRGHHGISVGNLIGSNIFNLFGVLGLAAIMHNLPVDVEAQSILIALSLMVFFVLVFMRSGWQISRKEGIALVALGLICWIISFS